MRLSEQVFVCNNTLGPGIGYTPHQLVLGIGSGVPGIYQVPESESSQFARSQKRIKKRYQQKPGITAPLNIRGWLPLRTRWPCSFLRPMWVGQGYITGIFGREYRVAHSGTQISSVSKEYISPTIKTQKSFALKSALCPVLNTIKSKSDLKVRFKLGT